MTPAAPAPSAPWPAIFLAWALLALALGFFLPPPDLTRVGRLLLIPGPALILIALYGTRPGLRAFAERLGGRRLSALHGLRLPIGVLFLGLAERGLLPWEFATPAGVGDIVAGGLMLLVFFGWRRGRAFAAFALLANVFGFLDLANVLRTVDVLGSADRAGEFRAFEGSPLGVVPYFLVPILLATHVILFRAHLAVLRGETPGLLVRPEGR
ncbi:MAG: hypothetical protein AAF447_03205 [Myxococcota bacterium]